MATKKTLEVVFEKGYEPAVQLIKSLIETKDDKDQGGEKQIVGVEDGSVAVMVMNEKQYFDNKMSQSSSQKVLFIGDVKEKDSLEMIMETLYDQHGIKIGRSGNQLLITTSILPLIAPKPYEIFINEFKEISDIPATKAERSWAGLNLKTFNTLTKAAIGGIPVIGNLKGAWDDKTLIKNQQMLFAVSKLYFDFLGEFMKA